MLGGGGGVFLVLFFLNVWQKFRRESHVYEEKISRVTLCSKFVNLWVVFLFFVFPGSIIN